MKPFALPKKNLLRKSAEFQIVYRQGKRLYGPQFSIIFMPNGGGESRVGVSVHGVRKALRRNRIKRLFKEFFRLNRDVFEPAADVVFAVRKGFELDSLQAVEDAGLGLLKQK